MFKFLGIGAQKAGTTWLFEMLKQHPEIDFPINKEVHYWNRKLLELPTSEYLAHFNHPTLVQGEITPAYAFLPVETIQLIQQHLPDIKIIFIIRNPIDRAWSSAKMALKRAEMEFEEASDQWFIDHFNSNGSLLRGDYEQCIANWRSVYDYQQLLILNFDDIKQSPKQLLNLCCDHLNISHFSNQQLEAMNISQSVFSTSKQTLNDNLHAHLLSLYLDKISSLQKFLATDLNRWIEKK